MADHAVTNHRTSSIDEGVRGSGGDLRQAVERPPHPRLERGGDASAALSHALQCFCCVWPLQIMQHITVVVVGGAHEQEHAARAPTAKAPWRRA